MENSHIINGNCLIAQSGGPTSVINASAYGIIQEFLKLSHSNYKIYVGKFGIHGILEDKIKDITPISEGTLENFRCTPSAGLGSCRYKLDSYINNPLQYKKLVHIFKNYNIKYFFYIGGNDSMDTAGKISSYLKDIKSDIKVIGIPKTIDNDLVGTDNCPGFGSSAKFLSNVAKEIWFDINTYEYGCVAILETMGRDAGWLAASTGLVKEDIPDINHLIYIPEIHFSVKKFINDVKKAYKFNNKVLITTSEGLKDKNSNYICTSSTSDSLDSFGHKKLGGVGRYLEYLIRQNICDEVRLIQPGIIQRCAMHCISKADIDESEALGRRGLNYAACGCSGYMVSLERTSSFPYTYRTKLVPLNKVCNKVKSVPLDWMDTTKNYINEKMVQYAMPLIQGEVNPYAKNGLIKTLNTPLL